MSMALFLGSEHVEFLFSQFFLAFSVFTMASGSELRHVFSTAILQVSDTLVLHDWTFFGNPLDLFPWDSEATYVQKVSPYENPQLQLSKTAPKTETSKCGT